MIGLAFLVVFTVYLLISIGLVRWAIGYARKNGKNVKVWGWGAAFVMYNIMFWDWIPTVALHQYYCAKDSGFWIYKTLDQWKAENPGVVQTLVAYKDMPYKREYFDGGYGTTKTYFLNQRFSWSITQQDMFSLLPIMRTEQQVNDLAKNEVLARYVDFGTGNSVKYFVSMPLRLWLNSTNCSGGAMNKSKLIHYMDDAENILTKGEGK